MRVLISGLALVLCSCATSSAGLQRMGLEMTISSSKSAQDFATCSAEVMQGSPTLRGSGDHWWVLRDKGYGIPIVRWDFIGKPGGGSVAELRATAIAGAAKDKVRACSSS